MRTFITDQSSRFADHLQQLCLLPVISYNRDRLVEKRTTIEIDTRKSMSGIDLKFLFEYAIFPEHIMSNLTQWKHENRSMMVGDTILQQVYIPPFPRFSQKLIFGVRISEIIDEPERKGFSYETLEGHVEKGISTFTVESTGNGKIVFSIHTFSKPATILSKIAATFFSIPYQAYCTACALKNVKKQIESQLG